VRYHFCYHGVADSKTHKQILPLSAIRKAGSGAGRRRKLTRSAPRQRLTNSNAPRKPKEALHVCAGISPEFCREHFGSEASTLSVAEYAQQWLERRKVETSLATHRRYQNGIDKWLEFLEPNADRGIEMINPGASVRIP
jgi:hypothetical protein